MAVAFDAASTGFVSGASSLTISHTVGSGSNRALVVAVTCINSTDFLASATATYGGVSMGSPVVTKAAGTANNYVYVWVLANPTSGTANVVITPSGSAYLKAVASSYTGVDQTTPVSSSTKYTSSFAPSPVSNSITVLSGGMAVDFICDRNSGRTITPDATQTRLGSQINGTLSTSSGSYKADATAMQWTHNGGGAENVSIAVVALAPAGGGTSPVQQDYSATRGISGSVQQDFSATRSLGDVVQQDFSAARNILAAVQRDFTAARTVLAPAGVALNVDPDHVLRNNTGSIWANTEFKLSFYRADTDAFVVNKTVTTNASGLLGFVSDAALTAGVNYDIKIKGVANPADMGLFNATAV